MTRCARLRCLLGVVLALVFIAQWVDAALPASARASGRSAMTPRPAPEPVPYSSPLPDPFTVVHLFAPPATRFGAGHLGVDLAAHRSEPVRAAGAGIVRFAGSVAGRPLVVLAHPDGITTEYEPVQSSDGLRPGSPVRRGQVIGVIDGTHRGCDPGRCLHWGAKRGDAYLDPLSLLRPLGPVRLLPWEP